MAESNTLSLSPTEQEKVYRRNFVVLLIDAILFSVAMGIIGPTTLIPDFIRRLTSSEILIGFSSSMFDVGWTLPQLFIARYIVRFERKKWWFVGPNIPVRFVILIFAVITVLLGKDQPGLILLAFLICYGIAAFGDGIVGVPWADLTGTSLSNRWRARMFGLMSAATGLIMLAASPLIGVVLGDSGPAFPNNYALVFGAAGILFVISILPGLFVHELPGGKAAEKTPSLGEFLPGLGHVLLLMCPRFRAAGVRACSPACSAWQALFTSVSLPFSLACPALLPFPCTAGHADHWQRERRITLHLDRRAQQCAVHPAGINCRGLSAYQCAAGSHRPGRCRYISGFLVSGLAR
ncbi:MAG: hypothetical protein U0694_27100 [Anaerolineae bacterium]